MCVFFCSCFSLFVFKHGLASTLRSDHILIDSPPSLAFAQQQSELLRKKNKEKTTWEKKKKKRYYHILQEILHWFTAKSTVAFICLFWQLYPFKNFLLYFKMLEGILLIKLLFGAHYTTFYLVKINMLRRNFLLRCGFNSRKNTMA